MFSKNTTILKDINRAINLNLMEIARISRKYLGVLIDMHRATDCVKPHSSIGLMPYLGILIILVLIIVVAILIFFVEYVSRYFKRRVIVC
jgi:hypothetical protein